MKNLKKTISLLLAVIIMATTFTALPFTASAAENLEMSEVGASSGTTGDCTWTLDDEGVLTISGNGEMDDFSYKYNSQYDSSITTAPWGASIKSVVIENGVTSIGKNAFYGCKSLTSVSIGNGVKSIGDSAFLNCTGLTSVTIPDSVTSIGYYAFKSCSGLTSIIVDSGNEVYDSRNNCNAIIETEENKLLFGCKSTVIPDSVTSIEEFAFYGCTGLTSVTIPDRVTSIGGYAFYGCTGLTNVNIPDSVTSIGYRAFSDCASLTSITIPDNVTSIDSYAFSYCSADLVITCNPGSAAERYAISEQIKISNPEFIYNKLDDGTFEITKYLGTSSNVIIPRSHKDKPISSVKNWLFANNTKIQSVTIPDSVTKIGKGAFYNCVELKTVTMGSNVKEIGANAFEKCLYLENINLSDNLQTIGDEAFYDCRRLKKLDIPATVTSIGEEAFTNCRSLTSLTIPKGVDKIGDESSLGYGMFENCQNLTEVTIPKTVSYIQSNAFDGCKNLTILGSSNSYAKSYAENNNIKFRAIAEDMPIGDANGDNTVDVLDAAAIQKHASGISELNSEQLAAADVNGDGNVDVLDAADIQKYAAGIISEFKKKV